MGIISDPIDWKRFNVSAKTCWWKIPASLYVPARLIWVLTADCWDFIWGENSLPFHMHRHDNLSSIIWSKSFWSLEVLQICIPKSQKYSLEELSFCLSFLITGQPCRKWVGAYVSKYLFTIRKYLILVIKGSTEYTYY